MYVLDTDVIIDYIRGKENVVGTVDTLDEIYLTVASLAELSYGAHHSKNPKKHLRDVMAILGGLRLLGVGIPTSFKFGEIKTQLMRKGKPSSDFDILIASSCLVHEYTLVTGNKKHFENVPGLKLLEI